MKSTLCIEKQIFLDNPGMYLEIASERPVSIVEGVRLLRLEEVVPASTEVSEHDKTICAALVMDSMVKDIAETEGRKYGDVLKDFVQSHAYMLWSSFFVTLLAKKYHYSIMQLPLLHAG